MKTDKDLEKIGRRLKELRMAKGFTSGRKFAAECEMESKNYWGIEHGKTDFRYSTLRRILKVLDMTVVEFYQGLNDD